MSQSLTCYLGLTSLAAPVHDTVDLSCQTPHPGVDVAGLASLPIPVYGMGTLAYTPPHLSDDEVEPIAHLTLHPGADVARA